jgi:streptogramin lyase
VWLANYAGRSIGRLSPIGGSIADYPLSASVQPQGITAGPDGNVWFTEANSAVIGRITHLVWRRHSLPARTWLTIPRA